MQAVRLTAWRRPPVLADVPEPEPGPDQVLVRVGGAAVCRSDLDLLGHVDADQLPFAPPFTLGHENAGWVEAVGPGVDLVEVGEAVAVYGIWGCGRCRWCRQGFESSCDAQRELGALGGGFGRDGGMARLMLVPHARFVVPIDDLDPVVAAPLTDAGLTAYHAVKRSLHVLVPGTAAVVVGVGGVGHLAVQYLRELTGAQVIAIDQRREALELARQVGADHTLLQGVDTLTRVRELTEGRGADVVLDVVGRDATLREALGLSRPFGHVTLVGGGGGSVPFGFATVPHELSLATAYWGSAAELMEVLALARAGRVLPRVEPFALADAPHAFERLAAGEVRGRAVVVP